MHNGIYIISEVLPHKTKDIIKVKFDTITLYAGTMVNISKHVGIPVN